MFANGVKILNRDGALNAAKAAFGQGSDGKINVPNVADFFVLAEDEADLTPSGKQAGLKQHAHRMGVHGFSGTIKLDSDRCNMNSTNACGGGMYVHNGTY